MTTKAKAKTEAGTTPRAQKREQTRERLYRAAMAEFARVGTAKAQISDVAKAAGVAYGSFYVHFDSKDEVLRECARRHAAQIVEVLSAISLDEYTSARDFFARLAREHIDAPLEVPELREEIWVAAVRQPRPEDGHPHILAISQLVADMQERGLVRDDRPAPAIALAFLTSLIGILVRSAPEHVNRATADILVDIFADALGQPGGVASA
jgi:AcrR family transcriptional regulator